MAITGWEFSHFSSQWTQNVQRNVIECFSSQIQDYSPPTIQL